MRVGSLDNLWPAEPSKELDLVRKSPSQEKEIIEAALSECGGRVYGPLGAASRLGMPRTTLESKIKSLKINKNRFRDTAPPGRAILKPRMSRLKQVLPSPSQSRFFLLHSSIDELRQIFLFVNSYASNHLRMACRLQ